MNNVTFNAAPVYDYALVDKEIMQKLNARAKESIEKAVHTKFDAPTEKIAQQAETLAAGANVHLAPHTIPKSEVVEKLKSDGAVEKYAKEVEKGEYNPFSSF